MFIRHLAAPARKGPLTFTLGISAEGTAMEHLVIYFKHGIRDIIPYSEFIERVRSRLSENALGEYLGDDMAIDGGDAEGIFSCTSAAALFNHLRNDLCLLSFMKGAKITFVFGCLGTGAPQEEFVFNGSELKNA